MCKKIMEGEGCVRMSFRTRRLHVPLSTANLLEGSSGLQEAYTKACPNSAKKITAACWCHVMTPCQVSWFSGVFLDLHELKNQVSQSFRPSHDAQMFEFHSHFLHGTYKFTQGHTSDFSTNFGALEPVLVVQIWIMHIKCAETQLTYKKAKRTWNYSKI